MNTFVCVFDQRPTFMLEELKTAVKHTEEPLYCVASECAELLFFNDLWAGCFSFSSAFFLLTPFSCVVFIEIFYFVLCILLNSFTLFKLFVLLNVLAANFQPSWINNGYLIQSYLILKVGERFKCLKNIYRCIQALSLSPKWSLNF